VVTLSDIIITILLGANLIADATHLVEAAFGAVADYYFPSSKQFFLSEADYGVPDAPAFGVVFGRVEFIPHMFCGLNDNVDNMNADECEPNMVTLDVVGMLREFAIAT